MKEKDGKKDLKFKSLKTFPCNLLNQIKFLKILKQMYSNTLLLQN